jgi:hypothetical protein
MSFTAFLEWSILLIPAAPAVKEINSSNKQGTQLFLVYNILSIA